VTRGAAASSSFAAKRIAAPARAWRSRSESTSRRSMGSAASRSSTSTSLVRPGAAAALSAAKSAPRSLHSQLDAREGGVAPPLAYATASRGGTRAPSQNREPLSGFSTPAAHARSVERPLARVPSSATISPGHSARSRSRSTDTRAEQPAAPARKLFDSEVMESVITSRARAPARQRAHAGARPSKRLRALASAKLQHRPGDHEHRSACERVALRHW
jgi:hypothetical protein